MEKLIATISENTVNNNNAGAKAKDDIIQIAKNNGYNSMMITNPHSYTGKLGLLVKSYFGGLKSQYLTKADLIVFQYAGYFNFTTNIAVKEFRTYNPNAKLVLLIHDVATLRYQKGKDWKREFKLFNQADQLIVHNRQMKLWLQSHGITTPIITLKIFDYLTDLPVNNNTFNKKVVFAGNLEKSTFLTKLKIKTSIELFGPHPANKYPSNISYKGIKKPDELAKFLTQSFGLVWDGDNIHQCDGLMGNYEKYNDPHKVSLYLSSGLPVILWKQAALANFITQNNLGIAVNDLAELDDILSDITLEQYEQMKQSVHKVAEDLRAGKYTQDAFKKIESSNSKL